MCVGGGGKEEEVRKGRGWGGGRCWGRGEEKGVVKCGEQWVRRRRDAMGKKGGEERVGEKGDDGEERRGERGMGRRRRWGRKAGRKERR